MLIVAIGIYLIITFVMTAIGIERHNEGLKMFLLSLVLTPLYGLFLLLKNKNKAFPLHYYYCPHCNYIYPVKLKHCPICEEKGKKVKLVKFESPHKLTKLYKQLTLA